MLKHVSPPPCLSWVAPSGQTPHTMWSLFVGYWKRLTPTNKTTKLLPESKDCCLLFQRYVQYYSSVAIVGP